MDKRVAIEVVYALPEQQVLISLSVTPDTTARAAVLQSGIGATFPALDLAQAPLGIFGKRLQRPEQHVLHEGDRVEIYRPLLADPKEIRRQRAARVAKPS